MTPCRLPHRPHRIILSWPLLSLGMVLITTSASALEPVSQPVMDELMELSLQDLLNMEVTSVSKKPQTLSDAPAAVFVITQDDIRRSGVTSIPEALRMAPGVQVARIDANKWAIGIRGFNGRFANKLLVLMDGRSMYTPLFGGVFWDVQDTVLEDIERIEVIRGPGATLWGANAVNGVINIITKQAKETQGGLLSIGYGSEERGFGMLRYGGALNDGQTHYRIYAKYFDRDDSVTPFSEEDTADDWHVSRAGFRLDWEAHHDAVSIQGDLYTGKSGETLTTFSPDPPRLLKQTADEDIDGGNLLLRWQRTLSTQSKLALKFYYDRTERDWPLGGEVRDTFDLDFQHRFPLAQGQDIVWGLGYRHTQDELLTTDTVQPTVDHRNDDLFSAFIQDDITLLTDRLRLTLGSKFEHNDYSGLEIQPNARLLWTPDERQSLWVSVARAVRTPTRSEHDFRILGLAGIVPPGTPPNPFPVPLVSVLEGSEDFAAEELLAYELGYRIQATEQLSLDLAAFYNDYDKLLSLNPGAPVCAATGIPVLLEPGCVLTTNSVFLPLTAGNDLQGTSHGLEAALDWRMLDWWRWHGSYAYLHMDLDDTAQGLSTAGQNPRHQFSLRSAMNLSHNLELDLWLRYVDDLPDLGIDSYLSLDARLAWRLYKDLELSIVGQNLLEQHQEFISELGDISPTEVERSVYGQIKWVF